MTVLYKILEATDDKFKDKPTISAEITDLSACILFIQFRAKKQITSFFP